MGWWASAGLKQGEPHMASWLVDLGLGVATFAGSVAMLRHGGLSPFAADTPGLDPFGIVLAAASTLPLVAWRRAPGLVFGLTSAASVALAASAHRLDLLLGPTVALYGVALTRPEILSWRTPALVLAWFTAYLAASGLAQRALPGFELLHTGLAWMAAWFAGERTRLRRQHVAGLKQRAARVEREAERERLLAIAEERGRIARDLHDSVGQALTLIAVRAGAARMRHIDDPQRSINALQAIEELARRTAEDMDHIVQALRDDDTEDGVEEPTGFASLPGLVRQFASAGLDVSLRTTGEQHLLPQATDQAAFRIIQESLTNSARHGSGAVEVDLEFQEDGLELTITNPLPQMANTDPVDGHGIMGMTERAELVGGTLSALRSDGVFRVRAWLPYGGSRS